MRDEDRLIIEIDNSEAIKHKYSVLSLLLNRTRLQLYRRLHTLKMIPSRSSKFIFNIIGLFMNIIFHIRSNNLGH